MRAIRCRKITVHKGIRSMKVGIIGAGSIGMLIGSYLAEANLAVTMFVRDKNQCVQLQDNGIIRVNNDHSKVKTAVLATMDDREMAEMNLLIVAVKYNDLASVLQKLKDREVQTPLLFIQNGLAHLSDVKEGDFPHVAFATVEHGALKKDPHTVSHNGIGKITIGERFGDPTKFNLLEEVSSELFPVIRHKDASFILLRKVIINCLINPLTTILQVTNGELTRNPHAYQLMEMLYDELMEAFPEMKEGLPFKTVEAVCRHTARNHSSMLADFHAGRPMEIATIVSAVIVKAKDEGKSVPLLKTYENLLIVLDKRAER